MSNLEHINPNIQLFIKIVAGKEIVVLYLKQSRKFGFFSTLALLVYVFFFLLIYPGDTSIMPLIDVVKLPQFQMFFGLFPDTNFYFLMWVHVAIITFVQAIVLALGLYLGIDTVLKDQTENTYDLTFSVPYKREFIVGARLIGGLIYALLFCLVGFIFMLLGASLANQSIEFNTAIHLWIVLLIFTIFGVSLGFIIGTLIFERGLSFQLVFLYFFTTVVLFMLLNSIEYSTVPKTIIDLIEPFVLFDYYKIDDILYFKKFEFIVLFPIVFIILVFFSIGFIVIIKRDLVVNDLNSIFYYIRHFNFFKKNNISDKHEKQLIKQEFTFSRILVYWSVKLRKKYPVFVDDLWANGLFLLLYSLVVFLLIVEHLSIYPGDVQALPFLNSFSSTPLNFIFIRDYDISKNPFLGFISTTVYSRLLYFTLPYVLYRFYQIETRDKGKTDELLFTTSNTQRKIILQRYMAVATECMIINIMMSILVIFYEIIYNKLDNTLLEITVIFSLLPFVLCIGLFISLIIGYFPNKGKIFVISIVFFSLIFYLGGLLNTDYIILAKITPYYYFDPVKLIFEGFDFTTILNLFIISILGLVFVVLRLLKREYYIS